MSPTPSDPKPASVSVMGVYDLLAVRAKPCGWCQGHHTGGCPRLKAIEYHPSGTVKRAEFVAETAATTPVVRWWGSDCILSGGCQGNTTPDSMRCDTCGSDRFTVPLYVGERQP